MQLSQTFDFRQGHEVLYNKMRQHGKYLEIADRRTSVSNRDVPVEHASLLLVTGLSVLRAGWAHLGGLLLQSTFRKKLHKETPG